MSTQSGIRFSTLSEQSAREDEGQRVAITLPDGSPATYTSDAGEAKPVTVTVRGTYSSAYRRALEDQRGRNARLRATQVTGKLLMRNQIEAVVASMAAWDGFFDDAGQPVPLGPESASEVLEKAPWIREQIEEAMNDHAGFSGGGSRS